MELFKKYMAYIKLHKKYYIAIWYLIVLGSIISLVYPAVLKVVIDNILIRRQTNLLKDILIILCVSYVINNLINYSNGIFIVHITQEISISIRKKIVDYIQRTKVTHLNNCETGDLISKTTGDVQMITQFFTSSILAVATNIVNLIVYILIMFYISKRLTLIALIFGFFQLFISFKFSEPLKENRQLIRIKDSHHINFLTHVFKNIKFYKSQNKSHYNNNKYKKVLIDIRNLSLKEFIIRYFFGASMSFITFFGSIALIGLGINEIIKGNMTVGMLFVFDSLSERFYQYSNSLVNFNIEIQNAYVSMERVENILAMEQEEQRASEDIKNEEYDDEYSKYPIELRNISFNFKEKNIFKNTSLSFKSGGTYFLVGPSGQGKTTMAHLLLKFYEIDDGVIFCQQKSIADLSPEFLREKITYVMQENIIIDDSVKENLLLGNSNVSQERFDQITRLCYIDDFVKELPNGYNTMLGENGLLLSEGQKQRISIGRALLRDTDIYIFDEITSSLDKKLAIKIIKNIRDALTGKIKIFITHDTNIMNDEEEIIILNNHSIEAVRDYSVG